MEGGTFAVNNAVTRRRDVESFYHLAGCNLSGKACQGTACFAARHKNLERWKQAITQVPRVYCLGQCFVGPSVSDGDARPKVNVYSRQGIVLERIVRGGARPLPSYTAQGGYRAVEQALVRPLEEILQAVVTSGLRGRGGAGF